MRCKNCGFQSKDTFIFECNGYYQYRLGEVYENGEHKDSFMHVFGGRNTDEDLDRAVEWYLKAADNGDEHAIEKLKSILQKFKK